MVPRIGLDILEDNKIAYCCRNLNPLPAPSLVTTQTATSRFREKLEFR